MTRYFKLHFSDGIDSKDMFIEFQNIDNWVDADFHCNLIDIIEKEALKDPFHHITLPGPYENADAATIEATLDDVEEQYVSDCIYYSYWDEIYEDDVEDLYKKEKWIIF